jgi:uncharacterized protein YraI
MKHLSLLMAIAFVLLLAMPVPAYPQAQSVPTCVEVLQNAYLCAGPGPSYRRIDSERSGDRFNVAGCSDDCSWRQLDAEM